jgi:SagB-type dehydrogenase family enzyme
MLSVGVRVPLRPPLAWELPGDALETVIRRRGSARRFTRDPISFRQLSTLLTYALHSIPADCFDPTGMPLSTLYVIANAVEDLDAGTYVLNWQHHALEQLEKGTFRNAARLLSLGQDLGGDAAVNLYFLADLDKMLNHFGNRGYRVAQLEAAILAGNIYLSAYALSLGATGLTFFDNDVTDFFSPQSAGESALFLVAVGHPMKRGIF